MSDLPILYSFRRCPYAIRARLALCIADVPLELREVLLKNKPSEMVTISPKGTVPVLQLQNGTVIDESIDVMRWALGQNDPEKWLGTAPELTDSLIAENDNEFKYWLDRYKYFERFPEHDQQYYRDQAVEILKTWENRLSMHSGAGLVADRLTLADMALLPFVRQFAHSDLEWFTNAPLPLLRQWLDKFKQSDLFKNVMFKLPCWEASQEPTVVRWQPDKR